MDIYKLHDCNKFYTMQTSINARYILQSVFVNNNITKQY